MNPQVQVMTFEVFPVDVHIIQKIPPARIDQDQRNVGVMSLRVTELIEATVTMVRPFKESQLSSKLPIFVLTLALGPREGRIMEGAHQSPWMVQEPSGPTAGSVSQN